MESIWCLLLTIFVSFSPHLLTEAKITSAVLEEDGLMHIKLTKSDRWTADNLYSEAQLPERYTPSRSKLRRVRSAPSTGAGGSLGVHTTWLPDGNANHNEAMVHWTDKNSSVMFILSRNHVMNGSVVDSQLWRSNNRGQSFVPVHNLPANAVVAYYMSSNSNKKKLVFIDNKNHQVYRTKDEGQTYNTSVGCGTSSDKILFHPTKEDSLLCYCEAERKLYASNDLATTWDLIDSYVNPRFFWGVVGQDETDVVHMEVLDPGSGNFYYKAVTAPYPTVVKIDSGLGTIEVDSLLVINEYIFVQKSSRHTTWLYVSHMRKPFKLAYFPNNHHPKDMNIINADESRVFVAGSQAASSPFYTISDLYLSDATGQFYITSLESVTNIGLREVQGLRGVYTVNQKKGMGSNSGLQTFITFDQGGKWLKIQAPKTDHKGKDTNCKLEEGCSLHLTHVFSEKNAPGILLGIGTYGIKLTGYDNVTLLMSTDGGISWKFVLSDSDQYEANILDQGGAVVAVASTIKRDGFENIIHYSHDEGENWSKYNYTSDPLTVNAVLNEPGIETRSVLIFGQDQDKTKSGWVVIMVNFSSILSRKCDDADYVNWYPRDPEDEDKQCLLGQKLEYKRRKAKVECYNGQDYENAVSNKSCKCLIEDYECDYGYVSKDDKCTPAAWFRADRPVGDCPEGSSYKKSKGWRKVAADRCTPDIPNMEPTPTPCPIMGPDGLQLILTNRQVALVGRPVNFTLIQERGSKNSTKYTWNFGTSSKSLVFDGYKTGSQNSHIYNKRGLYSVSVSASNSDGTSKVTLDVVVEDSIQGVHVEIPHGAQVNVPVLFEVTATDNYQAFFGPQPGVHYSWKFGEEVFDRDALLTWETSVTHTYKTAKNYTVIVEAMNGADSVYQLITVPVYGTLKTVQLTFESALDEINDGTLIWQDMFGELLRKSLVENLNISYGRIDVEILKDTSRTVADVSLLPASQEMLADPSIDTMVKKMLNLPSSKFVLNLKKKKVPTATLR